MSDHDSGQLRANEENRGDTERQNNYEPTQQQEFETATGEKPEIPSAGWWNTLRAPLGATPRRMPSTRASKIRDEVGPQEAKSPARWKKLGSLLKSTPTDTGSAREQGAMGTPERVVDQTRQDELKASFQKEWNRKQRKEQKYEAIFPMDLEKHAKSNAELQYLKRLHVKAKKGYEPGQSKTHDTRQRKAAANADRQPALLIKPRRTIPKEHMLYRGRIENGMYQPHM